MSSLAEQMVEKLAEALVANAGATTVTIDGQTVAFADLEAKYDHWKARLARERGKAPAVSRIRLDQF